MLTKRDRIAATIAVAFSVAVFAFCVWGLSNPIDTQGWTYASWYHGGR